MQDASDYSPNMTLYREQLADLNGRILTIDQAIKQLKDVS
jgi:hypothetical protein